MQAFHSGLKMNSIIEGKDSQDLANRVPTQNPGSGDKFLYPKKLLLLMLETEPHDRLDIGELLNNIIWNIAGMRRGDIKKRV